MVLFYDHDPYAQARLPRSQHLAGTVLAENARKGAECAAMDMERTKLTPKRRKVFLEMLGAGLTIEKAAKAIGVTRETCYQWRRADASFREDWEAAIDISTDQVEAGLFQSARDGDVTAAIFLLRSRKPEVYNPNLVIRRQMLQLALERARAEAGAALTIEGSVGPRPMIYPVEARDQFELPKLLSGTEPALMTETDDPEADRGENDPEEEEGAAWTGLSR